MSLKKFVKRAGKTIGKAKNVLLPLAGVAAGLALPGIGGLVGKVVSKGTGALNKVKDKGFLGIGDKKPGIAGIGTGKGILKALGQREKSASASETTAEEDYLARAAEAEDKGLPPPPRPSEGIPMWAKVLGGGGLFWALTRR